jgi:hypothetical protein
LKDEKLKKDKIEKILQFKVNFSNKTIATQRKGAKSKQKRN